MTQVDKILCSIIIVSKDNLFDVTKTISSVLENCNLPAFAEILVVDDSVGHDIETYVTSFGFNRLKYFRGDGISLYSAMNIGIENATGSYLWFLNSGDCKSEDFNIASLELENADIIYGHTNYLVDGVCVRKQARPGFKLLNEQQLDNFLPCHQSILFRRGFIEDNSIRYDTRLKISADYRFLERIVESGSSILYRPVTISEFALGGMSNRYESISQVISHANEIKQTRRLNFFQFLLLAVKLCRKLSF